VLIVLYFVAVAIVVGWSTGWRHVPVCVGFRGD